MAVSFDTRTRGIGFTLIEILVVVAVIGMLASITFVALGGNKDKGRIAAAQQFYAQIDHVLGLESTGKWKLDSIDTPTNTTPDLSGYGYAGSLRGVPLPTIENEGNCIIGKCMRFTGNQAVDIGNKNTHNSAEARNATTVSVWFNADTLAQPDEGIGTVMSKSQFSVDNRMWTLQVSVAGIRWIVYDDYNNNYSQTKSISAGNWHHVAGTWDKGKQSLYVDGKLAVPAATLPFTNLNYSTGSLLIGSEDSSANYWFKGRIDEAFVYNQALTVAQIEQLYAKGVQKHGQGYSLSSRTLAKP